MNKSKAQQIAEQMRKKAQFVPGVIPIYGKITEDEFEEAVTAVIGKKGLFKARRGRIGPENNPTKEWIDYLIDGEVFASSFLGPNRIESLWVKMIDPLHT